MARLPASTEARELRISQLLDAALSLWQQHPERIPSVAEVADAAGLAKGTIYLYFKSKEDLLLAAHERHTRAFFSALIERASRPAPMEFDDVMKLTRRHITGNPAFLPLATLVAGLKYKGVTPEAAEAFDRNISEQLMRAGQLLCAHFPLRDAAGGVQLLMRSYALMLGLWQLMGGDRPACAHCAGASALPPPDYPSELDAALRALWQGTFNQESPHA